MNESATSLRERRIAATETRLTTLTRELAAEHGLSGFTIEELCEQADVSRRTFFNYFASKEDALLGNPLRRDDSDIVDAFLAGGDASSERLSADLLDDFADLVLERWTRLAITRGDVQLMKAVFDKEPRLLGRMIEKSIEEEQADARLIERREGLAEGDLRALATVQIIGSLTRSAGGEFLQSDDADFADLFHRRLAAARDVFGH